jgi:protein-S-isoprenylcysteine O-methyltransferase Ste14
MPFSTPAAMLTSGPFRLSRNPLYVASIIFLTAFSPLLDSAWVLATVPVMALALDHFIIPGEEARLRHVFGDRYTAYSGRVRRWL